MACTPKPLEIYRDGDRLHLVVAGTVEIRSPSITKARWVAELDPVATGHSEAETEFYAERLVTCWNALAGCTDEQVAAVKGLIAWFTNPLERVYPRDETDSLRAIFPRRGGGAR